MTTVRLDVGDRRDFLQAALVSLAIGGQCRDTLRLPLVHVHHVPSDSDLVARLRLRDSDPFSLVLVRNGCPERVEIFAFGQLHERQPVAPGEDDELATVEVRRKAPEHRVL